VPRKPRFTLPGVPQHVIQRGNNREPCFFVEEDYNRYLTDLSETAVRHACAIHAYCLMTNHVHLLMTPMREHSISQTMQALGRRYVYYVNKTYRRTGTLWEGRYKASLIDSEAYLLSCMRYIELNPVRANMVEHPGEYRWSSYTANAQGEFTSVLTPHPLYLALDPDSPAREHAYRELFRYHLDTDTLHEIRKALNHELVLGRSYFKEKIERMTSRQTELGQPGRPRIEEECGIYFLS